MCGRYSLTSPVETLRRLFGFEASPNLPPRWNIAPTQDVPVVCASRARGRVFGMMRWGLVPHWADDPSVGSRLINARAETVADKPSFRDAFRRRRCLVLADGFYEWQPRSGGEKQPFRIARRDGAPFAFAGLWSKWQAASSPTGTGQMELGQTDSGPAAGTSATDGLLVTCAIVTTDAFPSIRAIHSRMPVILDPARYDDWLLGDEAAARAALAHPLAEGELAAVAVSRRVNNVRNDDAGCAVPVEGE